MTFPLSCLSLLVHSYDNFPCPLFVSSLPYFVFCCVLLFVVSSWQTCTLPFTAGGFLQLKDFNTCCCHLFVHRELFICWVSIFNAYALLPYQSALSYCDLFLYEYKINHIKDSICAVLWHTFILFLHLHEVGSIIHPSSSSLYQIHRGAGAYTNCNRAGVHPSHQAITGLTQRDGQLFSSTASSNHHLTSMDLRRHGDNSTRTDSSGFKPRPLLMWDESDEQRWTSDDGVWHFLPMQRLR